MTSCGLNGKPLSGKGIYEARIACNLTSKEGTKFYGAFKGLKGVHPYFTQTGKDREKNPDQYIANMRDGAIAGFKYFSFEDTRKIKIVGKGSASGCMKVTTERGGIPVAEIVIRPFPKLQIFEAQITGIQGVQALYFTFYGTGSFDFHQFELQ